MRDVTLRAQWGGAVMASAEVTNWGLRFGERATPTGNADEAYLAQYNALFRADTEEKVLYLTFDAGFENGCTAPILDALKKHNVPATFFLVGNYLETQPDLVRRMVEEGHTVGNHTYSHPDMSAIADEGSFRQELEKNEALYRELTGQEMPKLYRPPQGKFCQSNLEMAQTLGCHPCVLEPGLCGLVPGQSSPPGRRLSFKLVPRCTPGTVVQLHSTSPDQRLEILDELLTLGRGHGLHLWKAGRNQAIILI